ncbi:MFS transporter [Candidatus Nitrospira bockiana]
MNGIRLLKTRDFGLLWWGQVTSQVGDTLNKVALLWFVYELTGSALKMTVIGLLQTIPPLVFGPLLGVYLDRWRKKDVMIAVDLARTVMILSIPLLYAAGELTLERLYVLVFLVSLVSTIFGPALMASLPLLVKPSELVAANALMQTTNNIGLVVGPAVSGLGIALVGAQNVLYIDAITFLVSAVCLIGVRLRPEPQDRQAGSQPSLRHELIAGFRFVFVQHRTVAVLVLISGLYHLGVSAFVFLLPVYTKEHLQVGPMQLGWLWSGLGAGMLLTSAWLAWTSPKNNESRLHTIGGAMAIGGCAMCALSILQTTVFAMTLIIVIGASTAVFNPIAFGFLQELTPAPLLGRVLTTFSTGAMASAMAGMAGFGWAADNVGASVSLGVLGGLLLVTSGLVVFLTRQRFTRAVPAPSCPPAVG